MERLVFVYGRLMREGAYAELLAGRRDVKFLGPARCRGTLYDLGSRPGLVLKGRTTVAGEIYRCEQIEETLALLDPLEAGDGFERRLVTVRWRRQEAPAWAYVYSGVLGAALLIPGGSWKARLKEIGRSLHPEAG
jgi:gamma-glutamylcyclotransferase (GGCT)/AIG2-like uncharacterized protein YtfP